MKLKINRSKKEIKRIFKQKFRDENGDICQTGLAIAGALTDRGEKEKYQKIWKIIQDAVDPKNLSGEFYTVEGPEKLDALAEKIAENLRNPKVWREIPDPRKPMSSFTDGLVF